ncbi:DUF1287 domain-containing protein [Massilia sp. CF038]|uniref:DUF1287 domain-containing protein n=1 Tax=Massilia sp. CF038 TaxID=1881045 RepID=UPI0009163A78|nr:DUF1287 domain-containing protein [Massilia sp. CF038]SHH46271.1 hypothetical protein SAMN05428948_4140 [Massilia sp. CF038]
MTLATAVRSLILALIAMPALALAQGSSNLVTAARTQIGVTVSYNPRYEKIAYPNGDVPQERGVCTDVVIRAYRKLGHDLQALVHEDMGRDWAAYPKLWQLKARDSNIDHRRVPNLQAFFKRQGGSLPVTRDGRDYRAGDVVTWMLPGNLPHIGIVSDQRAWTGAPMVIHNIGAGTREENVLFDYPLTGHYRWNPRAAQP